MELINSRVWSEINRVYILKEILDGDTGVCKLNQGGMRSILEAPPLREEKSYLEQGWTYSIRPKTRFEICYTRPNTVESRTVARLAVVPLRR